MRKTATKIVNAVPRRLFDGLIALFAVAIFTAAAIHNEITWMLVS